MIKMKMKMSPQIGGNDLHWLAGVIDKGCAITATRGKFLPRGKAHVYVVRLCISSTNFQLVERVHTLTGMGYISTALRDDINRIHRHHGIKKANANNRYTLLVHGVEAARLLEMVLPYLRTQGRKVEVALALQKVIRSRRSHRTKTGSFYRRDVDKVERLVTKLKEHGTRTKP